MSLSNNNASPSNGPAGVGPQYYPNYSEPLLTDAKNSNIQEEWPQANWGHDGSGNGEWVDNSNQSSEWIGDSVHRGRSGSNGKFGRNERDGHNLNGTPGDKKFGDKKFGRDRYRDNGRRGGGEYNHWKGRDDTSMRGGVGKNWNSAHPYDRRDGKAQQQSQFAIETRYPDNSEIAFDHQHQDGNANLRGDSDRGFRDSKRHHNYNFGNNEYTPRHRNKYDNDEPISTVYACGFPDDIKERELRNMTKFIPGFQGCTLFRTTQQIVGFIKFSTNLEALNALEVLNNTVFDVTDREWIITATLAKRNMMTKNRSGHQAEHHHQQLPAQQSFDTNEYSPQHHQYSAIHPRNFSHDSRTDPIHQTSAYARFPTDTSGNQQLGNEYCYNSNVPISGSTEPNTRFNKKRRYDDEVRPECNTLCVRNIPAHATERDLGDFQEFVAKIDGYRLMNMVKTNNGSAVAFIRLEDTVAADAAIPQLQTYYFRGCRHPVSVQFAKRSLEIPV